LQIQQFRPDPGHENPAAAPVSLLVTVPANPVIGSAVTTETGGRIDSSVDLVLGDVIASMGEEPGRRILILVYRFDLFLVGVTVHAERLAVTGCTRVRLSRELSVGLGSELG